jgi:hypothetical protein
MFRTIQSFKSLLQGRAGALCGYSLNSAFRKNISPLYNQNKMPTLDDIEARLQTLLEVHLLKYLPGYKVEDMVYQQLASAMYNSLREQDGTFFAPNAYVIIAHPSTLARWRSEPTLLKDLAKAIHFAGEGAGFRFLSNPTVSTAEDPGLIDYETRIIVSFSSETFTETRGMTIDSQSEDPVGNIPANAFLVLDGTKIIPLNLTVLNIGRRLNNQVIINDKRVSRTHAQLRVTKGRFALFDLNSTGGTFVNGRRINQSILYPGDVISLAGVTLIYSQDLPAGRGTQKLITAQRTAKSSDRLSNVLHPAWDENNTKNKKS